VTYRVFLTDDSVIEVPWLDTRMLIVDGCLMIELSGDGTAIRIPTFLAGQWKRVELCL